MTDPVLEGKTVLVTGGSGRIGSACAAALVRDGAAALLMGRRQDALERAREEILEQTPAARVRVFSGDAMKEDDLRAAMRAAFDIQGCLDIVIPTLGGTSPRPILMHGAESFLADLEFNIVSAFVAVRHAVPLMARGQGGSIVCISSEAGRLPMPMLSSYATAKAGLEGLVRSAAAELARHKIRVNAVRPGTTRTDATEAIFESPELHRLFAETRPLGRLGEPEDVAAGVRYLAGPESSWVTGQSFAIEGGAELRQAPDLSSMVRQMYGKEAFDAVLAGRAPLDDEEGSS